MKIFTIASTAALYFLVSVSCMAKSDSAVKLIWIEGQYDSVKGGPEHTFLICNAPKNDKWNLWGSIYNACAHPDKKSTAGLQAFNGSFYRIFPKRGVCSDTLVVRYIDWHRPFEKYSWAPEGFVLETGVGKMEKVEMEYRFIPGPPSSAIAYKRVPLKLTDMIPALKSVTTLAGGRTTPSTALPVFRQKKGHVQGWYKIRYSGRRIVVDYSDNEALNAAQVTIENIIRNSGGAPVPDMLIEDWPDMQYRGLMLDVARAFLKVDEMKKFIDVMRHYKLNRLQFHLTDDEGWRLEIPGLPELTEFGAFHSIPELTKDGRYMDLHHLTPSYDGCPDPSDTTSNTNGYYSRAQFIELVRYAYDRGIVIVPEIDTPGHCRACVGAMAMRYRETGDTSYLLAVDSKSKPGELSAQKYHSNVLDVALPTTYAFIEKVVDEIISMYADAGVPLSEIHMGGDEVPESFWLSSQFCKNLMDENGWTETSRLKEYFVNRVLDIMEARGLKVDGWQEMALKLTPATQERLAGSIGFLNAWDTLGDHTEIPYKLANSGLPTLICNVETTYVDMAYNKSKEERGLTWGDSIDERTTFSLLPFNNYKSRRMYGSCINEDFDKAGVGKTPLLCPENVIGVQAHLWGENIRGMKTAGYMTFPKALGVFERGWNAHPVWEFSENAADPEFTKGFDRFATIIAEREFPYFDAVGMPYRDAIDYR